MKILNYLGLSLGLIFLSSCVSLKDPIVSKYDSLDKYNYIVLPETSTVSSSSGSVAGGQYAIYGGNISGEVDPSAVIEGILLKKGLVSLDDVRSDKINETLIVKYGESGKRDVGWGGYTIEVTISLINAKTYNAIYTCTAEGIGSTEAEDIREAINRCLEGL